MNLSISKSKSGLKKIALVSLLAAGTGLLTGCQTTIDEKPVTTKVVPPVRWTPSETPVSTQGVRMSWVSSFGDPQLQHLVDEAIENNLDLKIADARLESARQLTRIVRSEQLPGFSLGVNSTYSETNGAFFDAFREDRYSLTLGTSWEADLWGKIRNSSASQLAEEQATAYDLEQARQSIAANACFLWFELIGAKQQLELAEETLVSYQSTADLIQNRYESGIDSALEYRLALANLEAARSSVFQRKEALKQAQRNLQILLGRYPDASLVALTDFPIVHSSVPAGIPSDLLNRRPDIRAAERRLVSAELSIKSASKERLPSIQLTGATGTQTTEFKNLMDGNFDFWNLEATLSQPLFTGGRLDAQHQNTIALYKQSLANYELTALRAFMEVEQALDADYYLEHLEEALKNSAEQSSKAEDLAWDQYTSGIIDIVTVLESQRRALIAKQSYIDAKKLRLNNRVQLHLSLGGDF